MFKKVVIVIVVCLVLSVGNVALAVDVGSNEYNAELDILEVKRIAYLNEAQDFDGYEMQQETVLYIEEITDDSLMFKVEGSYKLFEISKDDVHYTSLDSGYMWEQPVSVRNNSNTNSATVSVQNNEVQQEASGGSGGTFKFTAYCSACNSPKGTGQTSSGQQAYVGSCAAKLPNGTVLNTPFGTLTVIDTPGENVIDVFIGYFDSCPCNGYGIGGSHYVTW